LACGDAFSLFGGAAGGSDSGISRRNQVMAREVSEFMRRSNFALRVPPTLLAEARKAAESEAVALNQLITLALAEKVSAMRTEDAPIPQRSAGF
jgi:hypothetical protein